MNFYHNLVTDKSWQALTELKQKYQFILIGGWAVFLYTKALKSKDIDLVLEFSELDKLRSEFSVSKNDRLKKYEARREEIEIDIYLPFYSNPGIPAEEIKKLTVSQEGFILPEKEALALLKQKALVEREASFKGRKDLVDLLSLFLLTDFDWQRYCSLANKFQLQEQVKEIIGILKKTTKVDKLDLNVHQFARLKRQILAKIEEKNE